MYVSKTIPKTLTAVIILAFIFAVGGVAYVFVIDRSGIKNVPVAVPAATQASPLPQPTLPAANDPEGVVLQSVASPVTIGSDASIAITTDARSTCVIAVTYNGVPSNNPGLASQTADDYGNITWTWPIDGSVPIGIWPIKITCTYHGRSGVLLSSFQVIKQD